MHPVAARHGTVGAVCMEPAAASCCLFATPAHEVIGGASLTCVISAAVSFRFLLRHVACFGVCKSGACSLWILSLFGADRDRPGLYSKNRPSEDAVGFCEVGALT